MGRPKELFRPIKPVIPAQAGTQRRCSFKRPVTLDSRQKHSGMTNPATPLRAAHFKKFLIELFSKSSPPEALFLFFRS
jgi:hypothetical protein